MPTGDMPIQRVFDDNYDYFLSSKELAKGFQAYVEKLNIVCGSSSLKRLWNTNTRSKERITSDGIRKGHF